MVGRVTDEQNDVFFLCSLIEYIARKTKNKRAYVVNTLGAELINHIYELADVYHSDNIQRVASDFIEKAHITQGDFDNVAACKYSLPTHFDIGKVYSRLVLGIKNTDNISVSEAVIRAYNSFVSDKIDDYNSAFYYDNSQNILIYYYDGMPYDKTLGARYRQGNE